MRFILGHIIACLCLGALLAAMEAWFVPVVEADDEVSGLHHWQCMMSMDVRECVKQFFIDQNTTAGRNYGCCKMIKTLCDEDFTCRFAPYCPGIEACDDDEDWGFGPDEEDDEDDYDSDEDE